jgi:hypothetical protein
MSNLRALNGTAMINCLKGRHKDFLRFHERNLWSICNLRNSCTWSYQAFFKTPMSMWALESNRSSTFIDLLAFSTQIDHRMFSLRWMKPIVLNLDINNDLSWSGLLFNGGKSSRHLYIIHCLLGLHPLVNGHELCERPFHLQATLKNSIRSHIHIRILLVLT